MSHQLTFADSEFSTKRRQTRKEIFLSRMEQILPWQNMTAVIEPFYPKAGNGRRPYPRALSRRLACSSGSTVLAGGIITSTRSRPGAFFISEARYLVFYRSELFPLSGCFFSHLLLRENTVTWKTTAEQNAIIEWKGNHLVVPRSAYGRYAVL